MKKKPVSLILAAVMVLAMVPSVFAAEVVGSGTCGDDLTWVLTSDGVLEISGTGEMNESPWYDMYESITSVVIKRGVTSICEYAFEDCGNLKSITIPDSVTYIGEDAFSYCERLTSITIPDSVIYIGDYAFSECFSLTSINVASRNKQYASVNGVLFNKDKTVLIRYPIGKTSTKYTIPSGVTDIGDSAFESCMNLTSVTIPAGVTGIGCDVFSYCYGLTSINVAARNEQFASVDGVLLGRDITGDMSLLLQYPIGKTETEYTIPAGVTEICEYAFTGCENLTSITMSDSVTEIGYGAFSYCRGLTTVTIPDSAIYIDIGHGAFGDCTSLTSITIPDSVKSIGNGAFVGCNKLSDVYYSGSEEQWTLIDIGYNNEPLKKTTIHFSDSPLKPEIVSAMATAENGVVKVTVDAENLSAENKLIVACYSAGEEYIASKVADAGGNAEFNAEGVKVVKVFLWKSFKSMKPLCEAKVIEIK